MQKNNLVFDLEEASDSYIESFVKDFIEKNLTSINKLCFNAYGDCSKLALLAFQELIALELRKACYSFVNNNHDPKYIESYLFSCIHKTIKNLHNDSKPNVYICPACKYLDKIEILDTTTKKLVCNACKNASIQTKNKWEETLFKIFQEHNRKGYRCPDCENFIPDIEEDILSCPYPNCFFVGSVSNLKSMRHPAIKANLEIPTLNEIFSDDESSDTHLSLKDDFINYLKILNECIDTQIQVLHYKSNESTLKNKMCMYIAFKNIIEKFPEEMISYLIFLNRNVRMQHKIFQEFVSILEKEIPFSFKKNGSMYHVKSLLDENLCVFDGISEFDAIIDEKHEIPNLTDELYVGGRKGSYCRPFYIGKVLDIVDVNSGRSLIESMKEYTFFKIIMNDDIPINTKVHVKHLRIPPHYQMGGMVYLNRIRRSIVDKVYFILNGKKRMVKNEK